MALIVKHKINSLELLYLKSETNKTRDKFDKFVQHIYSVSKNIKRGHSPDQSLLSRTIHNEEAVEIYRSCKFFKLINLVTNSFRLSETDKALLEYLNTNGFDMVGDSRKILQRFGKSNSSTIISSVKSLLSRNQKIVILKPPSSSSSFKTTKDSIQINPKPDPSLSNNNNNNKSSFGDVQFPISFGQTLKVIQLGECVTDRPLFHNNRYIYPAGFISEKLYPSLVNPSEKEWYRSMIIDRGGDGPVFRVEMKRNPKICFEGDKTSNPWVTENGWWKSSGKGNACQGARKVL